MKNAPVFILLTLIILLGGGGYFLINGGDRSGDLMDFREVSLADTEAPPVESPTDVPKPIAESTPQTSVVTEGTRSYKSASHRFGLLFPENLAVREYDEGGGSMTVTFTDEKTGEKFQIYVTPYSGTQITEERFKTDVPSGVYREPKDIIVDGTRATMFFSTNAIMGDVREVWFIHDGYLYEVTTYKELDEWLGQIMKTWKFS